MIGNDIIIQDLEDVFSRDVAWDTLRDKTVLITAPYGMLSSYITWMLIYLNEEKKYNITIIALGRSVEKFNQRFGQYANCDYINFISTEFKNLNLEISQKIDYIIHMASHASGNYFKKYPVETFTPNIVGTMALLELARENDIDSFLYFSSGDIYGKVLHADVLSENIYGEMDPIDEHSCYGESKRMAETMCISYYREYGIPIKIARIFPTFAPTMDVDNDPRAIAEFVKNLLDGEDIVMKSDGSKLMYFCYVADAIAAYFLILLNGKNGEVYNVGNNKEEYTIKRLAEMIVSLRTDKELKVVFSGRDINEHYVENRFQSAIKPDDSKIKALGWESHYTTKEGFERVFKYFQSIGDKL